jgi:hypothetical protein
VLAQQHTILVICESFHAKSHCAVRVDKAFIIKKNHLILKGKQGANRLWYLEQEKPPSKNFSSPSNIHYQLTCNSIQNGYQAGLLKEAMQFMHAALFPPAKFTRPCAVRLGKLPHWLLVMYKNISKHLSETSATHLSHLQRGAQKPALHQMLHPT